MLKEMSYRPLTATPFQQNSLHTEILPCQPLSSWIRCFWGTEQPVLQTADSNTATLVIPDTCVDIIYSIDHTEHTVSGGFCGINDHSFRAYQDTIPGHLVSTFAIRFYAWSACLFAEDSFRSTMNTYHEIGSRFHWLDQAICPILPELRTIQEMTACAEKLLMEKAEKGIRKENEIVNHTIYHILKNKGALEVSALAREVFVSSRQLERLFHDYVGITPKKLSNLIRYQLLWRDILYEPDFNILNAVYRYGYTDQAHLLHEFRRYHSMDIQSARALALKGVENIQDVRSQLVII